jgi:hypothetical protein
MPEMLLYSVKMALFTAYSSYQVQLFTKRVDIQAIDKNKFQTC